MSARPKLATTSPAIPSGAGEPNVDAEPTRGWKGHGDGWQNPRPPSVPATLHLTLAEYYAATSLMGLLSSQSEEPNQRWACEWAFTMGEKMAREAQKRRRNRQRE